MVNKVRPIKPEEVVKPKKAPLLNALLESFNELIAQRFSEGYATFTENDVMAVMTKKGIKDYGIIFNRWRDIKEAYESAGWNVEYTRGFNGSRDAILHFRR